MYVHVLAIPQFVRALAAVHYPDPARAECAAEHDAGALQCHQQNVELGPVDDGHRNGHRSHVQPEEGDRETRTDAHRGH